MDPAPPDHPPAAAPVPIAGGSEAALETDFVHAGLIVTFDFVMDREFWRYVPDDVGLHITRTRTVPFHNLTDVSMRVGMPDSIYPAVQTLTHVTDTMAFACTSGSFVNGTEGERRLRELMREAGARKVTTTSSAIVAACRALDVSRVGLVTPYDGALSERLDGYLAEQGISVLWSEWLSVEHGIHLVPQSTLRRLAHAVNSPEADAIVISCTGLPTYDLVIELERSLGKPVIAATQATMWDLLRLCECASDVPHILFQA